MRIPAWVLKMNSSFEAWKEKRGTGKGKEPRKLAPGPLTSRVRVGTDERVSNVEGVQSFNQMMRLGRPSSGKPPSEVGSVRSYRSVMTVEEQVTNLERKMEGIEERVEDVQAQLEENNKLLHELLKSLKTKGNSKP